MLKHYLLLMVLAFLSWNLTAQCPASNVTLLSQAEVDAFLVEYPNCTAIAGSVIIAGADITDLSALSNLTTTGNLEISENSILSSLAGLDGLTSVEGFLDIYDNAMLGSLSGISGLTSVNGYLGVADHNLLTSLSGLQNIDPAGITDLLISGNSQLSNCAIENICTYLGIPANTTSISGNAPGCANRMEVEMVCLCPPGDVILTSQAEVDAFLADYPNCTAIAGNLIIGDGFISTDITSLSSLSNLMSVSGNLRISANTSLTSFSGLNALASVGGYLSINNNHSLTSFSGLNALTSVDGYLYVYNNGSLASFSGLNALTSVGGYLKVESNSNLTSLEGLNALNSVGGYLKVEYNNTLTSFFGLNALNSVGGYLHVDNNDALTSLEGLNGLTSVGEYLSVGPNANLASLEGLNGLTSMGGYLYVGGNASLTSLEGLENINPVGITNLIISSNVQLSSCAVESICTYLGIEMSIASISGNATGCVDRMEVEMACNSIDGDLCGDAFDINNLLGQGVNEPQISNLYDNTNSTAIGTPEDGFECHFDGDPISHSLWVSFTGDGNTYRMTTIQCSATEEDYLDDTQMALYSGDCTNLMPVACNDDEDIDQDLFNAELIFETEAGVNYFLMLDGIGNNVGEFCLEVTRVMSVDVTDIAETNIKIFPNPTKGLLQFRNVVAESVTIFNPQGQRVAQYDSPATEVDMSMLSAGVYYLSLRTGSGQYSARVVKMD